MGKVKDLNDQIKQLENMLLTEKTHQDRMRK